MSGYLNLLETVNLYKEVSSYGKIRCNLSRLVVTMIRDVVTKFTWAKSI